MKSKTKKISIVDWIIKGASYLFDLQAELVGYDVEDLLGVGGQARDQEMIAKDWQTVGADIRSAMEKMDKEIGK